MTTGIVDKEDQMKQFSHALKQIEENIARVVSGSSTPGTTGRQLWPKILDTIGSLQQQMAREPYTPYRIWPHHS
jgi:hypothetical protein